MNTLVLDKPGQMRLTQTNPPAVPAVGQAIVRVHRVGICGTDWHAYHGRQPFFSYPRILGHELGVVVEQNNDPESKLRPGDRCAVEPYLNCGTCIACRKGKTNCCASLQCLGVHLDGGMRERIVVPARKLHKSDQLTLDQLALIEMLAIGCHAVDRASVERGETALIIGAGPIGLSLIPFARAAGARLIVADVSESRLNFCRERTDVPHVINARDADLLANLKDLTNGELPTLIFDATGNSRSMAGTFDLIAPGGRIVFVGFFQGELTFNSPNFHRREITLLATRNAVPENFTRIIRMVEAGEIDTTPWITHRVPCDRLVESLPTWLAPESGLIKGVIEF
jgi:2-desacetyl-2-hydroxyethyl bacteriochlorophyllide A dehydrogenase